MYERDELMHKARANKCAVDSMFFTNSLDSRRGELAAFLDFMHPELSDEEKRKLIRSLE